MTDDANSGVFIRCQDPKTITAANSYEVNIYDKRPDQSFRTGGIVDVAKPASVVMTGGKWNSFDITARGTKLTVVLNGMKMVDMDDPKHARGPIALQYGAGTVKFRNVQNQDALAGSRKPGAGSRKAITAPALDRCCAALPTW